MLWEFNVAGGVIDPIVRDDSSLFIASIDTNLYKIDLNSGNLDWRYQSGALLNVSPRVTKEVVYQRVRNRGMVAIDKTKGERIWHLDRGNELLTEWQDKAYVITKNGMLVVMDNKTAKQLYSVNFADVSQYVPNVADSRIYIADKAGRIACLKPVE